MSKTPKTFCNYPWKHLYVQTTGHFKVCCLSPEHITKNDGYYQYNLSKDKISDSWNSNYMIETRKKMLAGERLDICKRCYDLEDRGIKSMRNVKDYEHYNAITVDGKVNNKIEQLELHFGNVCNLACKMCSQQYSHKIGEELLKIGDKEPGFVEWLKKQGGVVNNWTSELGIVYDWFKNPKTKNDIFNYVSDNVSDLNVVGGEPTAIKEFYELLEFCFQKDTLQKKTVTLTTNLTNTNPKMITWLKKVKMMGIYGSVDGIGDVNDYIRYPSKWPVIERSLKFYADIMKTNDRCRMTIGPTFQSLNIHSVVDTVHYVEQFEKQHDIAVDVWWTGVVTGPRICDYSVLPDEYKKSVAKKLQDSLHKVDKVDNKKQIESHIKSLHESNDKSMPFKKETLQSFIKYNDLQDKHRAGITWRNLLPGLEKSIDSFLG